MRIVLRVFQSSFHQLGPAIFFGIVAANTYTAMIALIHRALQGDLSNQNMVLFIAAVTAYTLTEILTRRFFLSISLAISARIRLEMTQIVLATPLARIEELTPHKIFGVLHGEIETITGAISDLSGTIIKTLQVTGLLIYFGIVSPQVLTVTAVMFPVMIALYLYPSAKAREFIRRERSAGWIVNKRLEEAVFGIREISQSSAKADYFFHRELRPAIQSARQISLKNRTFEFLFAHSSDMLLYLFVGALIFIGGREDSANLVKVRDLVLFVLVIKDPARTIIDHFGNLYRTNIRLKEIEKLGFDLERIFHPSPQTRETKSSHAAPDFQTIEMREVQFTYPQRDGHEEKSFSLGPISLTIRRGEILFIVGGNGSGKTTLIKLLCGLYTPSQGSVLLDAKPMLSDETSAYKNLFHVIFSDFYLFEQIHLKDFQQYSLRASEMLKKFELENRISISESGYISDVQLSSGQRKRIAMIVAKLEDKPILILDEWAADQDPHFKRLFYEQMLPDFRAQGKTVIIISHDDRYFHVADRVLTLEDGMVKK